MAPAVAVVAATVGLDTVADKEGVLKGTRVLERFRPQISAGHYQGVPKKRHISAFLSQYFRYTRHRKSFSGTGKSPREHVSNSRRLHIAHPANNLHNLLCLHATTPANRRASGAPRGGRLFFGQYFLVKLTPSGRHLLSGYFQFTGAVDMVVTRTAQCHEVRLFPATAFALPPDVMRRQVRAGPAHLASHHCHRRVLGRRFVAPSLAKPHFIAHTHRRL